MKKFDVFLLDTANECLWRNGVQIALQPKPFAVLRYLVENPGRLITHNELLDALWPETFVQPQVLRTYMLELRKILGDNPAQPRFIQTLPKRGYCFIPSVTENAEAERGQAPAPAPHGGQPAEIVGRDAELAYLHAQAQLMTGGQRRVVLVSGEAGIGKTSLVDAFCCQAGSVSPALVARGQCVQGFGEKEEYYPLMEALGQLCASPDGELACQILSRMAPNWMAMLGSHAEPVASAAQWPTAAERKPGRLCAALEELAATKPLILVLEDLQWADAATLDLLSALARRRAPARLMVIATYRSRSVAPEHPLRGLKQELLLHRLCTEVAMAPLTRTAVAGLLSKELQQDALPPGLISFVLQHAEGNPLFSIILLRHLIAQRFLIRQPLNGVARWEQTAGFETLDAGLPDELAQMVELEIERLPPEEQKLLEAGSLMNIAFPAWTVAAALEADPMETEEACDALARKLYFLDRAGQDELPDGSRSAFYTFTHGLYREVLLQRQAAARRARRHIRIAERLGQLFAGREPHVAREMAAHYEAAQSWQRGAHALRAAARYALERQAHAEAIELLERALRIAENLCMTEREAEISEIHRELKAVHMTTQNACAAVAKI